MRSALTEKTRYQIRRIFVTARRSYTPRDAGRALGISIGKILDRIRGGEYEFDEQTGLIPWWQVAQIAMELWPLTTIYAALGNEAATALPALLKPVELSVKIPAFQVRLLEFNAVRLGMDVSEYLRSQVFDFASIPDAREIDRECPGFLVAFTFPEEPQP